MTRRAQQMGEFLREELTDIIRSELDDPRLGFWTVTRVEVPDDSAQPGFSSQCLAVMTNGARQLARCGVQRGTFAAI